MKERVIELDELERLSAENAFLREELVKRDLDKASGLKNAVIAKILSKYQIDPATPYTIKDGKLIVRA